MTIEVQALDDEIWCIVPHGRIDVPAARALEEALGELMDNGQARLVVEFSQAAYITSAGLKTLLSGMRRARKLGGDVQLAGLGDRLREIFEMAGFDQVFVTHADVAQAAAHLRNL